MCGITGFIDYNRNITANDLHKMTSSLRHRGPDGEGYKIWDNSRSLIGFGHRRLAIIDLSESGKQPMLYNDIAITYNGEIYNYKELKKELIDINYPFYTDSDTEVIIQAFRAWGPDCVSKFVGMFAFVLYDIVNHQVYFFRDRSGVKPLYIYEKDGLILFSSELKAFHTLDKFKKEINFEAVTLYFKYGFIPDSHCIFNHCKKVKPGNYIRHNLISKESEHICYWDAFSFHNNIIPIKKDELKFELNELLASAFNYRMVSDVPVGVFLSGGYDSSLVAAILQNNAENKIKTFNIGFEDPNYNESGFAEEVANYLGTDHISLICNEQLAKEVIPNLPEFYDEPFADSSSIPTFLVSKMTSAYVKVALSADGGDELFGGYSRNLKILDLQKKISSLPNWSRKILSQLSEKVADSSLLSTKDRIKLFKISQMINDPSISNVFDIYPQYFSDNLLKDVLGSNYYYGSTNKKDFINNYNNINALLLLDYNSTLSNDMMVKVDRATMANSLEGREPLVDHRLFEFLATVSPDYKIKNDNLKILLKEITHSYIPKEIMDRPKKGFGVPVSRWLKNDLRSLTMDHLSYTKINNYGILNTKLVLKEIEHQMSSNDSNDQLWLLLNFQIWCEKWL